MSETSINLRECPFCGSPASLVMEYADKKGCWYLQAKCSGCFTRSRTYKTFIDPKEVPGLIDSAVADWNRRTDDGNTVTE